MTECKTDLEKMAFVNSKEHLESCKKFYEKFTKMFNFEVPHAIVCIILNYCPKRNKVLGNWNSTLAYLETTPF